MRIMAIDYGDAHTGVAISDPTGFMAGYTTTINAYRAEVVVEQICALVKEYNVEELVLGYPKNMDGTLGPRAEKAAAMAELLKAAVERYDAPNRAVAAGSFWKADMFRSMVQEMSGVELLIPELPPIYGACIETMRLAQLPIPENFYENFVMTYRRTVC